MGRKPRNSRKNLEGEKTMNEEKNVNVEETTTPTFPPVEESGDSKEEKPGDVEEKPSSASISTQDVKSADESDTKKLKSTTRKTSVKKSQKKPEKVSVRVSVWKSNVRAFHGFLPVEDIVKIVTTNKEVGTVVEVGSEKILNEIKKLAPSMGKDKIRIKK